MVASISYFLTETWYLRVHSTFCEYPLPLKVGLWKKTCTHPAFENQPRYLHLTTPSRRPTYFGYPSTGPTSEKTIQKNGCHESSVGGKKPCFLGTWNFQLPCSKVFATSVSWFNLFSEPSLLLKKKTPLLRLAIFPGRGDGGEKNRLNSHDVRNTFVFCGLVPHKRADDSVQAVRDEKIRLNSHTFKG